MEDENILNYTIENLSFEPRARTDWYIRADGQIYLFLGLKFYQKYDKLAQVIKRVMLY
ncbi:MAG: hypothetical protein ACFFDH_20140 [Promethearchaeota archaeon]